MTFSLQILKFSSDLEITFTLTMSLSSPTNDFVCLNSKDDVVPIDILLV